MVLDINDFKNPKILKMVMTKGAEGLVIKEDILCVADGVYGLGVYSSLKYKYIFYNYTQLRNLGSPNSLASYPKKVEWPSKWLFLKIQIMCL